MNNLLEKLEVSKSLEKPDKHPSHAAAKKVAAQLPKPVQTNKPKPKAKSKSSAKKSTGTKPKPKPKQTASISQEKKEVGQRTRTRTRRMPPVTINGTGHTVTINNSPLREEVDKGIDVKQLISTIQKIKAKQGRGEDTIEDRLAPIHRDALHPDKIKANRKAQQIRKVIMPEGYSSTSASTIMTTRAVTDKTGKLKTLKVRGKDRGSTGAARSRIEAYNRHDTPGNQPKKTKKKDTDGISNNANAENTPLSSGGKSSIKKPNSLKRKVEESVQDIRPHLKLLAKAIAGSKSLKLKPKTANDNNNNNRPKKPANENKPGEKVEDVISRLNTASTIKRKRANDNPELEEATDPNDLAGIVGVMKMSREPGNEDIRKEIFPPKKGRPNKLKVKIPITNDGRTPPPLPKASPPLPKASPPLPKASPPPLPKASPPPLPKVKKEKPLSQSEIDALDAIKNRKELALRRFGHMIKQPKKSGSSTISNLINILKDK